MSRKIDESEQNCVVADQMSGVIYVNVSAYQNCSIPKAKITNIFISINLKILFELRVPSKN